MPARKVKKLHLLSTTNVSFSIFLKENITMAVILTDSTVYYM